MCRDWTFCHCPERQRGPITDKEGTHLLLQQRDEEVDGQHGVLHNLVFLHVDVADGDSETQDLFQLEFDGRLDLVSLSCEVLRVGDGCREFACFGKTGAEQTSPRGQRG